MRDRVKDGRDRMQNDGLGDERAYAMAKHMRTVRGYIYQALGPLPPMPDRFHKMAPEHPNYRYPQERTGDRTI